MDYKDTLHLPKTPFPMKGNLPIKEKEMLAFWDSIGLYRKLIEARKDAPSFILHDGPPYANGNIHLGTALNKILKDIIVKSKFMSGCRADYIPGWDCHGLPIEHQIEKEFKAKKISMPKLETRQACRKYAEGFIDVQRAEFKRLGVIGDWEHPYITMDYGYQATIIGEIQKFFEREEVYRKKKPVYWCISCMTALAEAEIEYDNKRSSSIYVKFPFTGKKDGIFDGYPERPIHMLIWTTTPWTLPANLAIAIHPDFTYAAVDTGKEIYIVLKELVEDIAQRAGIGDYRIIEEIKPDKIKGLTFRHPFIDRQSLIVYADYVANDTGTGAVHTAPGHGEEDYETGIEYGLDVYSPVNEKGQFIEEVDFFRGMNVFESNPEVIKKLEELGLLLHKEDIEHSYPHCWRCKKPVIFRATEQWFISLGKNNLRQKGLDEIDRVKWIPSWGRDRIYNMLQVRPDWCISRQRTWGIPITIFYCEKCREPYWNKDAFGKVVNAVREHGADIWFEKDASFFLPEGAKCGKCGNNAFVKEEDILDVWFDSGVSWSAVCKKREGLKFPVDLYLEGSDQHRGWFHSSLLTSVGNENRAPYNAVLTHGFVVDGSGRKMSKSLGNIIAPHEIIEKFGAEILRLWVTYEDYRDDIKISKDIINRLVETYRRIRNTLRFLHANINGDFDPQRDSVPYEKLSLLDKWLLSRLQRLIERVTEAYNNYTFHVIYHSIHNFCTVDLSALYLDIVKDRIYVEKRDGVKRRASQTVIYEALITILKLIAPILSSTADEMWSYLKDYVKEESVLLTTFPSPRKEWINAGLEEEWESIWGVREMANKKIEEKRAAKVIGHSLDTKIIITVPEKEYGLLTRLGDELKDVFIVSQIELQAGSEPDVAVAKAEGTKCERCWQYATDILTEGRFPNVCRRCEDTLSS
ncbi:MAG TPA: isoleucine--tRNA ligase [Syntrophorhabdaceae bacterium]|nr:isoleucine--tRNA ligase [Syntrophorhabdaceae bacterium]HQM81667.1 isoleucine--tRNA ligase [Syntrophorhabdaceae bacterium]